jgi:1-acyl-sn-glycerol-3-phosphate acyltransferase
MGIQGLADGIADFFFDQVEVEGAEQVPTDRPIIFAANHHSGLIDALLLYSATPREIRAVGKSTLWDILPLRPFLNAADVIPVKRVRDGGGSNDEAFAAVSEALVAGDAIAIFVEGTSHDNPGLAPIKTGAARMAFDAMGQGARPVIVPVGIVFEDRERFRSNALIRYGEPIDVAALHAGATTSDRDAVRQLTTRIEAGLAVVAPIWESEAQRAAARTSALEQLPVGASLSAVEARAEVLAELRPASLSPPDPGLVGERGEANLLVPPDQIDTLAALLLAPFALVGKWANRPPFLLVRHIAQRADLNIRATLKVAAGMILFPIWWIAIAILASVLGAPFWWALGIAAAIAVLGLLAARELPKARAERRTRRHLRKRAKASPSPD